MGQEDHRQVDIVTLKRDLSSDIDVQTVLLIECQVAQKRQDAQDRNPCPLRQKTDAVGKERRVSPELVDDDPADPVTLLRRDEIERADNLCEHAAAIDIPDQHHLGIGHLDDRPVHQIAISQIDLRSAAGAFDNHDLILQGEAVVTAFHCPKQFRVPAPSKIGPGLARGKYFSLHDDLRPGIGFRLEQNGIHIHMGGNSTGFGLQGLSAPDLSALRRDKGVQRHILRFEGRHAEPGAIQQPAEPGRDHAFPDV